MRLVIFRAVIRNRHVRTMVFLIVLFTSMAVPFYCLTGHFKIVEETASKYLPIENIYLILDADDNLTIPPGHDYIYVNMDKGVLQVGDVDIEVVSFSFSNPSIASKLLDMNIPELDGDECIVASYIADSLGLDIGDSITLDINGRIYSYRVAGFNRYFPVITPYDWSLDPDGAIVNGSITSSSQFIGLSLYRLGSYMGLVNELRIESIKILSIWSIPLYTVVLVGVAIISSRFLYSIRRDLEILYALGLSRRRITFSIFSSLSPVLFSAGLVGVCLGIVLSQASAKLLYIVLGGVVIYPVLGVWEYLIILFMVFLSALAGLLSTFMWSGLGYGEAD